MGKAQPMPVLQLKYAGRETIPSALLRTAVVFALVVYSALKGIGTVIVVIIPEIVEAVNSTAWLVHLIASGALAISYIGVAVMGLAWLRARRMSEPLWVPVAINVVVQVISILAGVFIAAGDTVLASPKPVRDLSLVAAGGHILRSSANLVLPILAIWMLRRPEERHAR